MGRNSGGGVTLPNESFTPIHMVKGLVLGMGFGRYTSQ